jgi:bifunctional DNA-binding transcriptional regulator/antitoxin component of YhaV-PrlF toxin-antitoxin module
LTQFIISDILIFSMALQLQTVAVIRQRGQLTIPSSIKKRLKWASPGSVVSVIKTSTNEIVIKPHSGAQKSTDWNKLWKNIELARSHQGQFRGSLSQFIADDRLSRR